MLFQATLNRMFDPQTEAINPDIFAPMTLDRYNQFVLIPYIACRLVAEDRKCSMEEAFEVVVASGDYGDVLQAIGDSDRDERFDDFLMNVVRKDTKVSFIVLPFKALTCTKQKVNHKSRVVVRWQHPILCS